MFKKLHFSNWPSALNNINFIYLFNYIIVFKQINFAAI